MQNQPATYTTRAFICVTSACQSMHCGFATPHVPEMQAVGCRMQSLSSCTFLWGTQGVWERPWGWISWFILMFNSWYSFHLCWGSGSITQGSARSEYRQWLPWLLNCFDCAHANACSILNKMAFVCWTEFQRLTERYTGTTATLIKGNHWGLIEKSLNKSMRRLSWSLFLLRHSKMAFYFPQFVNKP